jgi:hypothetical protein
VYTKPFTTRLIDKHLHLGTSTPTPTMDDVITTEILCLFVCLM